MRIIGNFQLFGGNNDKNTDRTHYINSPFVARYVRFHPLEWHGKISMRVGLLGCPHTGRESSVYYFLPANSICSFFLISRVYLSHWLVI